MPHSIPFFVSSDDKRVADSHPPAPPPGIEDIFGVDSQSFPEVSQAVLSYQRSQNPVYREMAGTAEYLPVEAFRMAPVCCFPWEEAERVFRSSGTGSGSRSSHFVRDLRMYDRSIDQGFLTAIGPGPWCILVHLPHYAEESSLVYMARRLVSRFGGPGSGFFLEDRSLLQKACQDAALPVLLLGAAFGLLSLVEEAPFVLPPGSLVIETGGMKTHRRRVSRRALHERLAHGAGLERARIWSEYGMCELLSQCYTRGGEVFYPPPWVRFSIRDLEDPTRELPGGTPGALALLDLANLYSASAVLTQDRAVGHGDGFEILGRLSGAELRGCNFLMPSP